MRLEPGRTAAADPVPAALLALTARPPQPVRRSTRARRWWIEALAIVWLGWVYDAITNLAPLRLHAALAHARGVLSVEQALHLDPEHSLDRWLVGPPLARASRSPTTTTTRTSSSRSGCWATCGGGGLTSTVPCVTRWCCGTCSRSSSSGASRSRRRGCCADSQISSQPARRRLVAHRRARLARQPARGDALASHCLGGVVHAGDLADHHAHRWLRALGVVYPCVTAFAVLATGNHFVFDIFGGLLTIALSVSIVRLFEGRLRSFQRSLGFRRRSARASCRRDRVRHVTKLLRSTRSARLAPPPQTVEGHFDGSPLQSARIFSSVGWPYSNVTRPATGESHACPQTGCRPAERVGVFLRYLDVVLVVLAVPVALALGSPCVGVLVSAVAWLIQRVLAGSIRRWIAGRGRRRPFRPQPGRWVRPHLAARRGDRAGRRHRWTPRRSGRGAVIFGAYSIAFAMRLVGGRPEGELQR